MEGKLVVEGLDLLMLLSPHLLDGGVDLQVQRGEEALVDGDLLDASAAGRGAHGKPAPPQPPPKPAPSLNSLAFLRGMMLGAPLWIVRARARDYIEWV